MSLRVSVPPSSKPTTRPMYVLCTSRRADGAHLYNRDLVDKPFFPKLLAYMISGPVVCMAWEGKDVVAMGRKMLGATNPLESAPGTIRGDFSLEVGVWFDEV